MSPTKESWVEIAVCTPQQLTDPVSNFLDELGTHGVFQEEAIQEESFDGFGEEIGETTRLETIKAYLPDDDAAGKKLEDLNHYLESLADMFPGLEKATYTTSIITDPDWSERWKKYFKPLRISKNIIVKPTWERYTPEGGDIVIDIDPGMAFGTGQHASTRLCVNAIEDIILKNRPEGGWKVLDVGTGTGILAMCCAKLGADHVTAIDLDQQAVEIAGVNIAINELQDHIDVYNRDVSFMEGQYNLVAANLTAPTLINLCEKICSLISPGGYLVASGITDTYINQVEKAYRSEDLFIEERLAEKEWVCIVFRKKES